MRFVGILGVLSQQPCKGSEGKGEEERGPVAVLHSPCLLQFHISCFTLTQAKKSENLIKERH